MLQIIGQILAWLVLIGLFFALYIYLGMLAWGWIQKRKQKKGQNIKKEIP